MQDSLSPRAAPAGGYPLPARLGRAALLGAAAALWAGLVWFAWARWPVSGLFNSDSVTELLYARHMAQTGKILPGTWHFTTEVRLFHASLVTAPFFAFTDSLRLVHTLAVAVTTVLLWGAGMLWARTMDLGPAGRAGCGLLFLLPVSLTVLDYFQGSLYYSFFLLGCLLLWAGLQGAAAPGSAAPAGLCAGAARTLARRGLWAGCAAFALVLGLCGIRYVEILFLPLGLAGLWTALREKPARTFPGALAPMALALTGLAGYGLLLALQRAERFPMGALSPYALAPAAQWPRRALEALACYGEALAAPGPTDEIFWLLLAASRGALGFRWARLPGAHRLYLRFALFGNAVNVAVLAAVDFGGPIQPRYTLLPCALAWPAIPLAMHHLLGGRAGAARRWGAALGAGLVLCAGLAGWGTLAQCPRQDAQVALRADIAAQLADAGCTFGYATYWNANVLTYASGGAVAAAPVTLNPDGSLSPFPLGCPHDYFQDVPGRRASFLLVSADETLPPAARPGPVIARNAGYTAYALARPPF